MDAPIESGLRLVRIRGIKMDRAQQSVADYEHRFGPMMRDGGEHGAPLQHLAHGCQSIAPCENVNPSFAPSTENSACEQPASSAWIA